MPLEILDFVFELWVVVEPIADVDDEIVAIVLAIEVVCDVRYAVSVYFFDGRAGREGHRDDSLGDMSEIEVVALELHHFLGAGY